MSNENETESHLAEFLHNPLLRREAGEGRPEGVDESLLGMLAVRESLADSLAERGTAYPTPQPEAGEDIAPEHRADLALDEMFQTTRIQIENYKKLKGIGSPEVTFEEQLDEERRIRESRPNPLSSKEN